jgi:hypothetical protein
MLRKSHSFEKSARPSLKRFDFHQVTRDLLEVRCIQPGGDMRAHFLTTTAAVALLAAMPAQAQDATWQLNPGTANYNTAANWTPATVPTGTAFFGATNVPNLTFSSVATGVGGWTFNAGAPAYTFTLAANALLFNGAGIVINAGSATINNLISLSFIGPTRRAVR